MTTTATHGRSVPLPPTTAEPTPMPLQLVPSGQQQPDKLKSCFVISPVGDRHAGVGSPARQSFERAFQVFEEVIHPACSVLGIEPVRVDKISPAGQFTGQVRRRLLEADLVIADVSGADPAVMYELGLRHSTDRPVIHLGELGHLPFGVAPIPVIRFERSPSGLVEARDELTEALARAMRKDGGPLTAARALHSRNAPTTEVSPDTGNGPDDTGEDSPGLMERFAELEPDLAAMSHDLTAMTKLMAGIAELTEQLGPELQRVARDSSPMNVQLAVTQRLATALSSPSAELRECACRFAERMAGIDSGVHAALDLFESAPPTVWSDDDRNFLSQLIAISAAAREGAETLGLFKTIMDVVIAVHRELQGPAQDIAAAVTRLAAALTMVETWDRRARIHAA
ncbi:hypothetical protein AB0O82_35135 [Kitasatospora sp. NPDC088264]|uniref:hypothetical protein n=1 Tax=Kitasatospora sp. NPDC088264 TaxID=3155296 RepID=UPI00342D8519